MVEKKQTSVLEEKLASFKDFFTRDFSPAQYQRFGKRHINSLSDEDLKKESVIAKKAHYEELKSKGILSSVIGLYAWQHPVINSTISEGYNYLIMNVGAPILSTEGLTIENIGAYVLGTGLGVAILGMAGHGYTERKLAKMQRKEKRLSENKS